MRSTTRIRLALTLIALGCANVPLGATAQGLAREPLPQVTQTKEFMRTLEAGAGMGNTVRPSVAAALMEAQRLMLGKDFKGAADSLNAAELIAAMTPYELHVTARVKGALAAATGDADLAARQYDLAAQGTWLSEADNLATLQTVAGVYYRAGNYAQAVAWFDRYFTAGGKDPDSALLRAQSHYLAGDYAAAAQSLGAELARDGATGKVPAEILLKLLADTRARVGDNLGYVAALEMLVHHYPGPTYWRALLNRVWTNPALSPRLHLDLLRLEQAAGVLSEARNYLLMAELALEVGFPTEASRVLEQGYAANVLGSGPDAAQHQALRTKVRAQAEADRRTMETDGLSAQKAPDGTALLSVGFNMVQSGQGGAGLVLMEQGLAKGIARNADLARLRLVGAYALAGQRDRAIPLLRGMTGNSNAVGHEELVRYWTLLLQQP